ncbi:hypothetical protein [Clostridium sp. M14]|uniref:hypothetical protein n=1 Tax=Clostridium sp. M14 TaxID=2716311 RepID=UPI0013EEC87C|nr:hypothetical protein [Clostridium sp. M14]MBZ9693315.1 hypothetical protein [Clostridium sp. M14]
MEFDSIEEFWDDLVSRANSYCEECFEDSKLITLKQVGGQELADFYKQNEKCVDFELFLDNILAGVKLEDIEELIEMRKNSDTLSICTINELLAINLECNKCGQIQDFKI